MNRFINYTTIIIFGLVFVMPLVWVFVTSISPANEVIRGGNPFWTWNPTFENYVDAWEAAPFLRYYFNTLVIVFGILGVQLITITLAAYAFARFEFPGKNVLFILFLLQLMIQPEILLFPNYQVMSELGLVDTKLAVMLPFWASAFGVFLLRQTFKQVPYELDEASKMDGSKWCQTLRHVYIPAAKPTYIAFSLVSISTHWSNFMWPLIITDSVENRPLTVGIALFAQSYETGAQWGMVSAGTVMVILPLLIAFFIFQKQFVSSFMHSGIK
ncbi:carbohydrate ABC transporter permease [Alkalibacillus haloalkaliphilus]|uniref:carbohydrate ABC transporter permease n=1 Tax=Alkalibacillus haloalkaliphilus TaxID=94136 RepID=UPI000319841C|nr:carbohydrate ABC transporter permease [Alkalibacillus haloalkaliphilus]